MEGTKFLSSCTMRCAITLLIHKSRLAVLYPLKQIVNEISNMKLAQSKAWSGICCYIQACWEASRLQVSAFFLFSGQSFPVYNHSCARCQSSRMRWWCSHTSARQLRMHITNILVVIQTGSKIWTEAGTDGTSLLLGSVLIA